MINDGYYRLICIIFFLLGSWFLPLRIQFTKIDYHLTDIKILYQRKQSPKLAQKNPLDEHTAKDVLITHFILNVYYFNRLHPNTAFLTMAFSLLWRAGSIKFFSLASQIETSQYSDYLSTSLAHKLNAGHKSSSS